MGFLSRLFGKSETVEALSEELLLEANVCPNCWGSEEYGGAFYTQVKSINFVRVSIKKAPMMD